MKSFGERDFTMISAFRLWWQKRRASCLAIVTWCRRTIKIHFWAHNEWKSARFGAWFLRIRVLRRPNCWVIKRPLAAEKLLCLHTFLVEKKRRRGLKWNYFHFMWWSVPLMRAALKPAVKFIYYGNMFNKKHNSGDFFNVSAQKLHRFFSLARVQR